MRTSTDLWHCALIATLKCWPTGRPGGQHHDLISYSVALYCNWTKQYLHYPNYVERLAQKQPGINFKVIVLPRPSFERMRFGNSDLLKQETDALLIRISSLVRWSVVDLKAASWKYYIFKPKHYGLCLHIQLKYGCNGLNSWFTLVVLL